MRAIFTRSPVLLLPLAVAIVAIIGAGCGAGSREIGASPAPDADTVVRVVDGDTVVLRAAGKSRLIGVDTPEVFGRRECFGAQASAFAKRMLPPGLRVAVRRGEEERDRYGRSLIYLSLPDGRSFNELLVGEGFAVPLAIEPNTRFADRFAELAGSAREARAGLWSPSTCGGRTGDSD